MIPNYLSCSIVDHHVDPDLFIVSALHQRGQRETVKSGFFAGENSTVGVEIVMAHGALLKNNGTY